VDYEGRIIGVISHGDVSLRVQPREASAPIAQAA
jgi:hypothetical protein